MYWKLVPNPNPETTARQLDVVELTDAAMLEAAVLNILNAKMGLRRSADTGACVLGDGRKIPMMSYGLIEYLMGQDLTGFDVLELGGGFSTAFWSARVRSVLTLETDADWARTLAGDKLANVEIRATTPQRIDADMTALGRSFDAIIVDASASRYRCAKAALALLKPGGFILLDNSDWYPNTSAMLRQADLIQVDYPDFRPLRWYRCVTSLFLHKDFRPKPRSAALPLPPMGGKLIGDVNDWDRVE
jgi:hypothetical protein